MVSGEDSVEEESVEEDLTQVVPVEVVEIVTLQPEIDEPLLIEQNKGKQIKE